MTNRHLVVCKSCRRQYDVTEMKTGEHLRCRCGALLEVPPPPPPHEARILHCSGCGGKLTRDSPRCPYCGGTVAPQDRFLGLVCPECFARLSAEARFCSECGVRIDPTALRAVQASAPCPRCKGKLLEREAGDKEYIECTNCGGVWLDAKFFEDCIRRKDLEALSLFGKAQAPSSGGGSGPGRLGSSEEEVRYLPCPVCGNLMHRKNFAGCSGVVIDWCKEHGFWFDAEELGKILRFVESGGLEKARERELRRSEEELRRLERARRCAGSASAHTWKAHYVATESSADWLEDIGSAFRAILQGLWR